MRAFLIGLMMVGALGLGSCSKFRSYNGPAVTRIMVFKGTRHMFLMHGDSVLASYPVELGYAPVGAKQEKGDGKTPEGSYFIDRKNPKSDFHLSIGISYPDEHDSEVAKEAGVDPGGDIFIHGGPNRRSESGKPDWTAGCIAVTDREMEDIYAMVRLGTPIDIYP